MKAICENPCHIVGKLLWTKAKTEKKRDVTKIQDCQLIGLVSIFTKKKLKKAPLPKMSLLVQIDEEIKAPVCSDDSLQIALTTRAQLFKR